MQSTLKDRAGPSEFLGSRVLRSSKRFLHKCRCARVSSVPSVTWPTPACWEASHCAYFTSQRFALKPTPRQCLCLLCGERTDWVQNGKSIGERNGCLLSRRWPSWMVVYTQKTVITTFRSLSPIDFHPCNHVSTDPMKIKPPANGASASHSFISGHQYHSDGQVYQS